ncbi:hypothetical protein [Paenibacillus gallinarum]|uniref:Uncharacterized protein n=1 Tax=Paenibacillus gallinarum TaxID=2762232 RepID=A0ABR8SW38_9BACL|nr:hypothetical protein [Paenibacillus gallinarum]MBD7967720.1 hypothetical protein [Paenibacillus gallinarum]
MEDQTAAYIKEIKQYRAIAKEYDDDNPGGIVKKIQYLTKAHMLMGRVSAHKDGDYKRIYNLRKRVYAEAKRDALKGDKTNAAELAVLNLRVVEAEAYESMHLWRNEFASMTEHLHELRLRLRVDLNTYIGGGPDV